MEYIFKSLYNFILKFMDFLRNPSGDPRLGRLAGNSTINGSILPILKVIRASITDSTILNDGVSIIEHNLNNRCDFYGRYQSGTNPRWFNIQNIYIDGGYAGVIVTDIGKNTVSLRTKNLSSEVRLELYFIDFKTK